MSYRNRQIHSGYHQLLNQRVKKPVHQRQHHLWMQIHDAVAVADVGVAEPGRQQLVGIEGTAGTDHARQLGRTEGQ